MSGLDFMWLRLVVDDFAAAYRFYTACMRMPGDVSDDVVLKYEWAQLANPSSGKLELELVGRNRFIEYFGDQRLAETALVFFAEEIDAAARHFVDMGGEIVVDPHDEGDRYSGTRLAQLRDPAGMLVELMHSWASLTPPGGLLVLEGEI